MGGFKRALLGYRRAEVDAAFAERGARIAELEGELPRIGKLQGALDQRDGELRELSTMVLERERDNRELREELRAAQERHDRRIASLQSIAERLEDVQAQARGQATRIRMKALSEAVEVSRRAQELAGKVSADSEGMAENGNGDGAKSVAIAPELFEGNVKLEIGPLDDFSQLVSFEDAAGQIGATSGISVERFSEGRATLALQLAQPTELLRELEERCPMSFAVRHTVGDHVVLDVNGAASAERRAA